MSKNKGVLFFREENGVPKWFENGDEDNDGKYLGIIENGNPNGQGTYTLSDGGTYVGEFKNGLMDGKGEMTNENDCKYLGEWKKSQLWNSSYYDKDGNIKSKWVNGDWIKQ